MNLAANLDHRIKAIRPEMSLNAVAKKAGVSQSVLYRAVNDVTYQPKRENLEKLAKFFLCSVDELFIPISLIEKRTSPSISLEMRAQAQKMLELFFQVDDAAREKALHYLNFEAMTAKLASSANVVEPEKMMLTDKSDDSHHDGQ